MQHAQCWREQMLGSFWKQFEVDYYLLNDYDMLKILILVLFGGSWTSKKHLIWKRTWNYEKNVKLYKNVNIQYDQFDTSKKTILL